jgi:hypothetical protein
MKRDNGVVIMLRPFFTSVGDLKYWPTSNHNQATTKERAADDHWNSLGGPMAGSAGGNVKKNT